ncbi:retrotransposon protein, putative, ty1-copia subclass [Tanacetum coccineum]
MYMKRISREMYGAYAKSYECDVMGIHGLEPIMQPHVRDKEGLNGGYFWKLQFWQPSSIVRSNHRLSMELKTNSDTDDFSRYAYVYVMKHQHEVFETFKVFQNEVENQLGKKIKAIRSDQGNEYPSHEFVNHMKSCGIVSQLTPPYTPQHNEVSKRKNRTLLDMVRSMMNLITLPKFFWGYALEYAVSILNMVPTKNVERTPYEIWHKKDPRIPKGKNRSARIPQAPDRYGFYVDVEEYELRDLNEPPNYKAALSYPESDKWLEAMNTEMQSKKDNQVWVLVELPPNGRTVGSKCLFKKNIVMDGKVHTFKARLVAKGHTHRSVNESSRAEYC